MPELGKMFLDWVGIWFSLHQISEYSSQQRYEPRANSRLLIHRIWVIFQQIRIQYRRVCLLCIFQNAYHLNHLATIAGKRSFMHQFKNSAIKQIKAALSETSLSAIIEKPSFTKKAAASLNNQLVKLQKPSFKRRFCD